MDNQSRDIAVNLLQESTKGDREATTMLGALIEFFALSGEEEWQKEQRERDQRNAAADEANWQNIKSLQQEMDQILS